jgi:hypothetical protein
VKNQVIILLLFFGMFQSLLSQTQKTKSNFFEAIALQTGYFYLGKNYGYIGFDKRIDNQKEWIYVNVGLGTYISYFDYKKQFVPEIHTNATLLILMGELSATTKAVHPSLGFNLGNRIMIKSGYNFAFKKENFEGITFGLNINLGSEEYHYLPPIKFL